MQIAIDMFEEWAKETGLTINTSKTKAMAFTNEGLRAKRANLHINVVLLSQIIRKLLVRFK